MQKNVHQKSGHYIKENFRTSELFDFYVRDFVNDGRSEDYSLIKINAKQANFVKHVNKLRELKAVNLLQFKVKDFAFYNIDEDYVKFTQKITEKTFPFALGLDKDYSLILYNIARNDYYNSMLKSLPGIFQSAKLIQSIFRFADEELKKLEFSIDNAIKNRRFLTARSEILEKFEEDYGLISSKNLSTIFRLNRIIAKRMLSKSAKLNDIKETMKLYFIHNENTTIENDKDNFQYIINFKSNRIDREYLDYWLDLIYEVIPAWYEIKIIY
ncbi:DUF2313 domain-containing protein [Leptotrichia sp. OH3620_COT-345]|uniref:DUF2313 domain-containing protein n=1 Tax=Leptotrichia sp. OH3620_COT-345 TaxID=2491048 RepID=UPI000F65287E|nr:DUF2313 domain-containing protein [Leptotrichia sp. OH3620_COT-345]RRD38826.1 DUF2313 domain-containing protein [Leptotrichia sp. OH3620_COT-345]